jgi:hypothetical protein
MGRLNHYASRDVRYLEVITIKEKERPRGGGAPGP